MPNSSLIKFNRRLFLGVYAGFFFFALCVVWQILWSGAGLRSVQEAAFLENESRMRRLEMQVKKRLEGLKQKLSGLCKIDSAGDLQQFRQNYPELNLNILSDELSSVEYKRCLEGESPFPAMILPYRLPEEHFEQLANSIRLFFAGEKHIPVMRGRLFEPEGELYEQIAALKIEPVIDYDRNTIEFRRSDMERLSALSTGRKPLFLIHEKMELEANYKFFGFNLDFFELWPQKKDGVVYSFQPPDNVTGLLQWLMQLAFRSESRFGQAPVVYVDNSGEKPVYRPDPRLDQAQQMFPDMKDSRGNFFVMRTEDNTVSYIWSLYPQDYGIYEHEKNQDYLGLLPEQVLVGYVNELRMSRLYAVDIIEQEAKDFDFGVQLRYGEGDNFAHGFKTGGLADFFSGLSSDSVRCFSSVSGLLSLQDAPDWFSAYFKNGGLDMQSRRPLDFAWRNEHGEEFYASLRVSSFLGGAHVLIYQPAWRFLKPYYLQWMLVFLLFLLSIPVYFYIRNVYVGRISSAVVSCLEYIEKGAESDFHPPELQDEMELLRFSMSSFKRTIKETMFHFDLHLGFQKILNEPHLTFTEYARRFVDFSSTLPPEYNFNLPGIADSDGESLEILSAYSLILQPTEDEQRLFQDKLHIRGEIKAVFPKRDCEMPEAERAIFHKYFRALLAGSLLEDQYLQSQNLKKDLELGEQVRTALSPHQSLEIPGLKISWQTFQADSLNGNFYDILPQGDLCHFYMVRVLQEGIGAGLIACYLKSFLIANAECVSSPAEMIKKLRHFIIGENFSGTPVCIFYGISDQVQNSISFASVGEFGLLFNNGEELEMMVNESSPPCSALDWVEPSDRKIMLPESYNLILYSAEVCPEVVFGSVADRGAFWKEFLSGKADRNKLFALLQDKFDNCGYVPPLDGMMLIMEPEDEKSTI